MFLRIVRSPIQWLVVVQEKVLWCLKVCTDMTWVTSSFWLERRCEFAYLYFLQPFCGRGMVTNGDSEVSFVFCLFLRLMWPLDVCYEL